MAAPDENPGWTCEAIVAALRGTDDAAAQQALEFTRNRLLFRILGETIYRKNQPYHLPGLIDDMLKVRGKLHLSAQAFQDVNDKVFTLKTLREAAEKFDSEQGNWYAWVLERVIWAIKDCIRANTKEWQPFETGLAEQTPSDSQAIEETPAADATSPAPDPVSLRLEAGLAKLSDLQRAVWTLRYCRIRELQKLDLAAMRKVSQRTQSELKSLIAQLHKELKSEEETDRIRQTEKLGQDVLHKEDQKQAGKKKKQTKVESFECKAAKLRYWQIRQRKLRDELRTLRVPDSAIDEAQRAAELIKSADKIPTMLRLDFPWAAPSLRDQIVQPWHQLAVASQKVGYYASQVENARQEVKKQLSSGEPSHRRIAEILKLKDDKASQQALNRAKTELVDALRDLPPDSQQASD